MQANNVQARFEGSEAVVLVMADGVAVRSPKRRGATAQALNLKAPADLLHVSQHPNVVRIFSIQGSDIYMESMHASLQQHMPPGKTSSFHTKLHVATCIAQGMHHLHINEMEHGDLCPANVLLAWKQDKMHVKLCDFYSEHTGIRRTAAYTAPEVVRCPPRIMRAADVWAFACCLLFLEGVQPFHGFEDDTAKFFYLGLHSAVAFKDGDVIKQFTLQKCAYEPARHLAETAWKDILTNAFLPEALRPSSQQLVDRLAKLETQAVLPENKQGHRVPLQHLNF